MLLVSERRLVLSELQIVLQCNAVCCSVLQFVTRLSCSYHKRGGYCVWCSVCCSLFQFVAVYFSVLHFVSVCCSVLQCVAVCCSVLCVHLVYTQKEASIVCVAACAAACVAACVAACFATCVAACVAVC